MSELNVTTDIPLSDPLICEKGGHGLLLPLGYGTGAAAEWDWPVGLRVVLYGILLAWLFQGVAIIADVFMGAIEEITSKRKTIIVNGKDFHVKTWNDTVANLTLMALGSSAPEILLSVVEIIGAKFYSGDLGPSCIVGSAAFNLLMITAVCIVAIDPSEIRKINDMNVFAITGFFSVFAYLWLLIVLLGFSPNIVNVSEGVITFLFFPLLVGLAYLADRGYFSAAEDHVVGEGLGGTHADVKSISGGYNKEDIAKCLKEVMDEYGSSLTPDQANKLALFRLLGARKKTRAEYRIEATRVLTGAKSINTVKLEGIDDPEIVKKEMDQMRSKGVKVTKSSSVAPSIDLEEGKVQSEAAANDIALSQKTGKSLVCFSAALHGFLESAGTIKVAVRREGNVDQPIRVKYNTRDGTASAGDDYLASNGILEFAAGEVTKDVSVVLIDDNQWEPDETFDIVLSEPESLADGSKGIILVEPSVSTITIINDDEPGVLCFSEPRYTVMESQGFLNVVVKRKNGSDGTVTCKFTTQDHSDRSAIVDIDYEKTEGTLVFDNAEIEKTFKIKITNNAKYERDERFQIMLSEATGGASFPDDTDGSTETETCVVTIVHDVGVANSVDLITSKLNINLDRVKVGSDNWASQFSDAMKVNGGDDDEDAGPPSKMDYVAHYTALPWKLFFATCPPVDFYGGWACFVVSLAMIGGVTVVIGDAAAIFGCLFGCPDSITAITFVALGTSLPDTFASMTAAKQDPYADASIGNITGSNSVNVFLGLGLPWMIASIYWNAENSANGGPSAKWVAQYANDLTPDQLKTGGFAVPAGNLGFSVGVFCACAISCFAILGIRRKIVGGELGGPKRLQNISAGALGFLWFFYILMSSLNALGAL